MSAGAVATVNRFLKACGRAERVRRGRGYFYVYGGDADYWHSQGIYAVGLDADPKHLLGAVRDLLRENEIDLPERAPIAAPFKDPTMVREFGAAVRAFDTLHKDLFRDGRPFVGSSFASFFWRGYAGEKGTGITNFSDHASREMIAFAYYRAGQACAARDDAEAQRRFVDYYRVTTSTTASGLVR